MQRYVLGPCPGRSAESQQGQSRLTRRKAGNSNRSVGEQAGRAQRPYRATRRSETSHRPWQQRQPAVLHFPLFSRLPRELRDQIWCDALPDKVGPALFFFREGCWCPRRLTESDKQYDPADDELNLEFQFRPDLLDDTQFDIPLVFVNREARRVALAWAREQGIEVRPCEGRKDPFLVRPLDLMRDALYITLDQWDGFLDEPSDRQSQPDLFDRMVNLEPYITRLAVSEALLRREVATLDFLFLHYYRLNMLLIIVDAQLDLQPADNDVEVQRRWEFENAQGGALFWDPDRGVFDPGDAEYVGDEDLYRLILEAAKVLGECLPKEHIRSFEIRPVYAVRR
ncbi:MAG: hypothetical protein M1818_001259 [Claussenomyces sp. TS43310]|nr:MAG: hypothetical protein M1818_001259 [Claussenomyces sp. TS43310]